MSSQEIQMDFKGRKFGKMTVIHKSSTEYWLCRCDCGKERHVRESNLETTPSCGCSHKHVRQSHGGYKMSEYRVYIQMIARCRNPDTQKYQDYGGRGITVCERWLFNFQNFIDDMGRKPTPAHEIDRIDNDGNYEPSNCRWATRGQQMNNTRKNCRITIDGETHTLTEWSRIKGISQSTLFYRIYRYGWSPEKALTLPLQQGKKPIL
jgi:hypothetical protein